MFDNSLYKINLFVIYIKLKKDLFMDMSGPFL